MINQIHLENYRRFERFQISLQSGNILVGPNNCGKSSILDSFKLLEACLRHSKTKQPKLLDIPGVGVFDGYEIPDRTLPFSLSNISNEYSEGDAIITFVMGNRKAVVRLSPDRQTRFYIDAQGARLTTSSKFRSAFACKFIIVPTLAALEPNEPFVTDETVQRNANGRLASRHLRNIWYRESEEEFEKFREEVKSSWKSVDICKPELVRSHPPIVQMFFSENRREREVQWAGFGFQAWLQIQTHLRRATSESILIIDEPDVYLHPDLQRKILKKIRSSFSQFVLATHSIEIINEGDAKEIVSIDSKSRSAVRIKSDEQYSKLYEYIGSGANSDFARIAKAKRVIFVEGTDGRLLRRLASRFGFRALSDGTGVPVIKLGGFTRWPRAENATWAFEEILGLKLEVFCLFDRDYRSDHEVSEFIRAQNNNRMTTRVLDRKEIENYFIDPILIHRCLVTRMQERNSPQDAPTLDQITGIITEITNTHKIDVAAQYASELIKFRREIGSRFDNATILAEVAHFIDLAWSTLEGRIRMVPGKKVLTALNKRLQEMYSTSLTDSTLISKMSYQTIAPDMQTLLKELEEFSLPE